MDSKKPLYKSIPFWIMVLFFLYSALGFLAVPYFLKKQLTTIVKTQLNSDLSIKNISFNPYTIAAEITDIKLSDVDETTWFSADKIHANLNLWISIFSHVSLSNIQIDAPSYNFILEQKENHSSLKYPRLTMESKEEGNTSFELDIDNFKINKGLVKYSDSSGEKLLNLNIKEIQFKQSTFTTGNSNTPFELAFTTENNDTAEISGTFNYSQTRIDAQWHLFHWSTATIFNFINDADGGFFGLTNKSGKIDANGSVSFSADTNQLPIVSIDKLALTDFNNSAQSSEGFDLLIPQLTINKGIVDLSKSELTIENINTAANQIRLSIDENNDLVWKAETKNTSSETQSNAWHFQINKIHIENTDILVTKQNSTQLSKTNKMHVDNLQILNLNNSKDDKLQLTLNGIIDESGKISLESQIQLSPFELNAETNIENLDINKWQAWLPQNIHIKLAQGKISFNQKITLNDTYYNSKGLIQLDQLSLLNETNQEFLSIEQLLIDQNNIDSKTKTISLNKIKLDHAQGSLLISENQDLNINNIISAQTEKSNETQDWTVEIKQLDFQDSETNLTDKSISPNYHSRLSQINGSINGLSSQNLSKADVKLSGVLDSYGKLSIEGQINPLTNNAFTDVKIKIDNMDMQNFSSYSSRYLGFPLNRGKADFELEYKLNQNLLKGTNKFTFNQLNFGESTDSPDAVNLPLKLAVSLLTDGKGLMEINLPVSGNIDDPAFSYGGLVFKAFFKLITSIVTSPFKLLGKLIPGGADLDLSGIQFEAGTSLFSSEEEAKLKAMKEILKQKPDINLELIPIINSTTDKIVVQKLQLLNKLNISNTTNFNINTHFDSIKTLFIELFDQSLWDKLKTDASLDQQLNQQQLLENAWIQLLNSQDVTEQLHQLAKKRAIHVQKQLIDVYEIPTEKLFLKPEQQSETLHPQIKFGIVGL